VPSGLRFSEEYSLGGGISSAPGHKERGQFRGRDRPGVPFHLIDRTVEEAGEPLLPTPDDRADRQGIGLPVAIDQGSIPVRRQGDTPIQLPVDIETEGLRRDIPREGHMMKLPVCDGPAAEEELPLIAGRRLAPTDVPKEDAVGSPRQAESIQRRRVGGTDSSTFPFGGDHLLL